MTLHSDEKSQLLRRSSKKKQSFCVRIGTKHFEWHSTAFPLRRERFQQPLDDCNFSFGCSHERSYCSFAGVIIGFMCL